jgi:hypothetical protein
LIVTRTSSAAARRPHHDTDNATSVRAEALADVVTVVRDQMQDRVLLRCRGAVVLPAGTVIETPDGEIARVVSVRLVASTPQTAQVVINVL